MGSCTTFHWEVVAHQGSCNTPGELWLWYITFKPQKLPLIWGVKVLHLLLSTLGDRTLKEQHQILSCSNWKIFCCGQTETWLQYLMTIFVWLHYHVHIYQVRIPGHSNAENTYIYIWFHRPCLSVLITLWL